MKQKYNPTQTQSKDKAHVAQLVTDRSKTPTASTVVNMTTRSPESSKLDSICSSGPDRQLLIPTLWQMPIQMKSAEKCISS